MTIEQLQKDLESQNFGGNLVKSEDGNYYAFGIALEESAQEVYLMAKVIDEVVYVSTVSLLEDISMEDIPYFMSLNDLMITGKLFLSTDLNDLETINEDTFFTIDYGFEILVKHYSSEMLFDYIQNLYSNLENILFATE